MVSMSHHMVLAWSECLMICCPCGHHVSPYIVYAVRASCDTRCQIRLSALPVCLTVCCLCGQSVSRYVVSIYAINMVITDPIVRGCHNRSHIFLLWSVCLTVRRIKSYCPCGQYVSPYIARVVRVYRHILYQSMLSTWSACIAHIASMYRHISSMWPECIAICCINS